MISRSRIHLLTVLAQRLEDDYFDKAAVKTLRDAVKVYAGRRADGATGYDLHEEAVRVERQRTAMAIVPDSYALSRLKDVMLQRAYDLLYDGDWTGCDAIAEFLPDDMVKAMLDAWENDIEADSAKSKFYCGERKNG